MIIAGKSMSSGVAIGPIVVYHRIDKLIRRRIITNPEEEIKRFEDALETTKDQLDSLYQKTKLASGEESASVFIAHQAFLYDKALIQPVKNIIRALKVNAEYAVAAVGDQLTEQFLAMDDDYMSCRAADIRDVGRRVVSVLSGISDRVDDVDEPVIVLADELAPSETVLFEADKILSFVTTSGSDNSHTAIMARIMGIPALYGVDFSDDVHGKLGIVDANKGILIIDPDKETIKEYRG